jgi:hypothetical protein
LLIDVGIEFNIALGAGFSLILAFSHQGGRDELDGNYT